MNVFTQAVSNADIEHRLGRLEELLKVSRLERPENEAGAQSRRPDSRYEGLSRTCSRDHGEAGRLLLSRRSAPQVKNGLSCTGKAGLEQDA